MTRDFVGERTERGDLNILLVIALFQLLVAALQRILFGAQLVEAGDLPQHAA